MEATQKTRQVFTLVTSAIAAMAFDFGAYNLTHSSLAGDTVKLADFGCSKRTDETLTCLGFTEQASRRRFRPWDLWHVGTYGGAKFHGSTAFAPSIAVFTPSDLLVKAHHARIHPLDGTRGGIGTLPEAVIVQRCGVPHEIAWILDTVILMWIVPGVFTFFFE